jgi:hypothetical protein
MRIYIQNPNGVSVGPNGDLDMILNHLTGMETDVIILPETNLDTNKHKVKQQIHKHCRKAFGHGTYHPAMATSAIEYAGNYKPGGILGIVVGKHKARILESGHDQYGRWVYFRMSGQGNKVITIIGTYQVCQENVRTAGPTTAIIQQYSMLVQNGYTNPHKVREHHAGDLTKFVKQRQNQGELVVVMGDFNEVIGDQTQGLTKLCSECHLKDVIFERHGYGTRDFNTYARGTTCIDYILMDEALTGSVKACGYLPFHFTILSDHRGLFVDVETQWFFGSDILPTPPIALRDYTSKNIHQTAPFIVAQAQHLEEHQWDQHVKELKKCIKTNTPNHELVEKIDRRRIQACQYAGRRLKKYGPVPYSPELMHMKTTDKLLTMIIRRMQRPEEEEEATEDLRRKLQRIGIDTPHDIDGCKLMRKTNKQALVAMTKAEIRTGTMRQTFQDNAINEALAAGNKEKARRIRQIQRAEMISQVWKKCAGARGLTKKGGLSYVLVPEDPTEEPKTCINWAKIEDPPAMINAINKRLQEHFSQTKQCTWTTPPLDVTMDFTACCDKAEAILNGTYNTQELDAATEWIVEHMKYILESKDAITHDISTEEFVNKLKAWDERTSTSPLTNVHLGHGKAYYADHDLKEGSTEEKQFLCKRQQILEGHVSVMNYCLQFGYSLNRWKTVVNSLLEKDPGTPKIHRLRVIHLYEWDYNLLLGIKWRQLLHHVVDTGTVNEACYGTMPGKSSLDPVFIKEMEYEIVRLTRKPLIHFDNDATSCYDRIPCFLANLASRKYGQSANVCMVQGNTLQEARYHLKTKFGISEEYVTHTRETPWFGTGQGSGNSPMYWLLISSTLYDIYAQQVTGGAKYVTPDGKLQIQLNQLGFVDDVNNRTNLPWTNVIDENTTTQLLWQASQDSQLWYDIMEAANQSLELTKCKYHVMRYEFKKSGKPIMITETNPSDQLIVQDKHETRVTIQHTPNNEAIKYLGCWKAPQGQKQQKEATKRKCDEFARIINCSTLTRKETRYFYEGIYKPSVGYPLPITYFKAKELEKMQAKAHTAMITHCGFNRNTATAIIYGTERLGGANFTHLYDIQGHGQIEFFIKSWRAKTSHQGKMARIALRWAQFCAGIGQPILENTAISLPHLESEWISSLRTYLEDIKGKIQVDNPGIPTLSREHDQHLMEVAIQLKIFKPSHLRKINYCRLYLNVSTISDIANANGDMIDPAMYEGNKDQTMSKGVWQEVHQEKPDNTSWSMWRRLCREISYPSQRRRYLRKHLGKWTEKPENMRRDWKFWHDPRQDKLYQRTGQGFIKHNKMWYDYDTEGYPANLPDTAVPAEVKRQANTWQLKNRYIDQALVEMEHTNRTDTIQARIEQLPDWEKELLSGVEIQVSTDILKHELTKKLKIASDGSVQDERASFGWVIANDKGTRLVSCKGPAYGSRPTSYRAEGYGFLSLVRFIKLVKKAWGPIGECQIVCDNEALVKQLNKDYDPRGTQPNQTTIAEWDIIAEIWETISTDETATTMTLDHIKGHADDHQEYNKLSLLQQLNVDADRLANEYIQQHWDKEYQHVRLLPASGIQLQLKQGTITYHHKRRIKEASVEENQRKHLCKKTGWSQETFDTVAWEVHRRALNRLSKRKTILIKYLHDITPVGKQVHRYDPKYPAQCPSCDEPIETQEHLHQCPHIKRQEWRQETIHAVETVLESYNTPKELAELWLEGIKIAMDNRDDNPTARGNHLQQLIESQTKIGWPQLLKGRISKQWIHYQREAMGDNATKRKNAETWATTMIETILNQWLKLWTMRNESRHGRDYKTRQEAAKQQAISELEILYTHQSQLQPQEEWILGKDINEMKKKSVYVLRAFINNFSPVVMGNHQTQLETG